LNAEALFDSLAADYEQHFAAPHRRAYDLLAWEITSARLPDDRVARVLDIGCGIGRWAERLLDLGHTVVGIEPAPAMANAARSRLADRHGFELIEQRVEDIADAGGTFDLILAMGSLQYCDDPPAVVRSAAPWLCPGGSIAVLVDSCAALVVELLRAGDTNQAIERAGTHRGCWRQGDRSAAMHLFDRRSLTGVFADAGLHHVRAYGLLVGATVWGRDELARRLNDEPDHLEVERQLANVEAIADLGKQLLVVGGR